MQRKHCNLPVAELVRVPAAPEVPRLLLLGLAALLLVPTASTAGVTDAVVRVYAGDGAGCGTLIYAHDGRGLVLTAAHVVQRGGSPQTQWAGGETSAATVVAASRPLDIALLAVSAPTSATTIPLAGSDQWPPQGETVELIGYGGGNLRHWQAKVNGYVMTEGTGKYQTLSLNTRTIGGDSGGAIVYRGRLVGVIWGGPLAGPRSPMLATHGTCCVAINTFLRTNNADPVQIAQRFPPACNGPICPLPPRIIPRQNPPVVVPQRVEPARVESPEVTALRNQIAKLESRLQELEHHPVMKTDIDAIAEQLLDRMAADGRFRGPPGRDGTDGVNGSDGRDGNSADLDRLADRVRQRLAGSLRIRVEPVRDKVTR